MVPGVCLRPDRAWQVEHRVGLEGVVGRWRLPVATRVDAAGTERVYGPLRQTDLPPPDAPYPYGVSAVALTVSTSHGWVHLCTVADRRRSYVGLPSEAAAELAGHLRVRASAMIEYADGTRSHVTVARRDGDGFVDVVGVGRESTGILRVCPCLLERALDDIVARGETGSWPDDPVARYARPVQVDVGLAERLHAARGLSPRTSAPPT